MNITKKSEEKVGKNRVMHVSVEGDVKKLPLHGLRVYSILYSYVLPGEKTKG